MGFKYCVDKVKYKADDNYIQVEGWGFETSGRKFAYAAHIDGREAKCEAEVCKRPDVEDVYLSYGDFEKNGFYLKVYLETNGIPSTCKIMIVSEGEQEVILDLYKRELVEIYNTSTFLYNIDCISIIDKKVVIDGWVSSENKRSNTKLQVMDSKNMELEIKTKVLFRPDLAKLSGNAYGFQIEFIRTGNLLYSLFILDENSRMCIKLDVRRILRKQKRRDKIAFIKQILNYFRKNGFEGLTEYIVFLKNGEGKFYGEWFKEHTPSFSELQRQKETIFEQQPKISIIVVIRDVPVNVTKEMIESVRKQTYQNWELCIGVVNEANKANKEVEDAIVRYSISDTRIKVYALDKKVKNSDNKNQITELAKGDYIGFMEGNVALAPNALYEIVKALQNKTCDFIYADEDEITLNNKRHMKPKFKPDFSIDLLRSYNYIGDFFVVRSTVVREAGGFRNEFDGAQDYDMIFRCIEVSERIEHIPEILYYCKDTELLKNANRDRRYEAGKRALEEHLRRVGDAAEVECVGSSGKYHVKYLVHDTPLVSIIIPNKDHAEDLDKCINSIYRKSDYSNFEIIIIENNSESEETFLYYEQLRGRYNNLRIVVWDKEFNYSKINNYGVQYAKGDYLLFLNNDTEMISQDAITEMLGCCMREEVGVVGAKLLYNDNTVQHAGVVIGFGNYAGHVNLGIERDDEGYMMRARVNSNYSAVTAACMMTKKSLFEQIGGFDEQLVVACNDIDFCLQICELGKLIVFNAFSEWYHYESKSRGYDDTDEKMKRYEGEVGRFQKKWSRILEEGDPFYNKNFPVTQLPFTLG